MLDPPMPCPKNAAVKRSTALSHLSYEKTARVGFVPKCELGGRIPDDPPYVLKPKERRPYNAAP